MPTSQHAGEVAPGLFVGSLASLEDAEELRITHVVSAVNQSGSLQHAALEGRQRHLVDVVDSEEANLLQSLPAAVAFVCTALGWPRVEGGPASASPSPAHARVLIHCAQGVSRSAAVAAACLMARAAAGGGAELDPTAALAKLRRGWPAAAPNPGFLQQLELFSAMGCRLVDSYMPYKRFLLRQAAHRYQEQGCLDAAALPQPAEPAAAAGGGGAATLYRCRKCRGLVATSHNVVEVEQGPGAAAFSWRKRDRQQRQAPDSAGGGDGSLFVEPLRWMCEGGGGGGGAPAAADSVAGGAVQGKLYCPKCGARLGSFNWAGTQSGSGAWVTPAFQLHLAKLDAVDAKPPAAVAAIRQPRSLGALPTPAAAAIPPAGPDVPAAAAQLAAATLGPAPALDGAGSGNTGGGESFFRYLVLDCDGVLVDSERASCEALRRAILQVTGFDIPHAFPEDFQPVFGMDVRSCVEYYQRRFGRQDWGDAGEVAAAVSAAKEPLYQELTAGGIQAFPGVPQLVAQARALGWGVAVASSGSPEKIAHNLGSSGLAHLFPDPHLVVSAKHVARGKPAPDVYVEALRRLGAADPSRALVVEDAVNGLKAAKAAGCCAVAVATSLPASMLEAHADLVVQRLQDLDLAAVQPKQA